jgi:hypothetical protein
MENGNKIYIRFLIILFSLMSVDGGRSFISAGNSVQVLLSHHNENDAEVPHQNLFVCIADDEKWIDTVTYNLFIENQTQHYILLNQETPSGKFTVSVWQPPKFL